MAAGVQQAPPDGLTPQEQLDAIARKVTELLVAQRRCLEAVLDALASHGVQLVSMSELTANETRAMDAYFRRVRCSRYSPRLAVDPGHPFPYISNLSISLAVEIRDPETGAERFARVKVPKSLPRWVPIADRAHEFVPLEQLIGAHLGALFPGLDVLGWYVFRITRYSDLELPNLEEPEDLLATIEQQVFKAPLWRGGFASKVGREGDASRHLQRPALLEELREEREHLPAGALAESDLAEAGDLLGLGDLMSLTTLEVPALKDVGFTPSTPLEVRASEGSLFDVIREHDVLVHHPFDSFPATVERRFVEEAAVDEHVLAIKTTLYRTSGDTAIVAALAPKRRNAAPSRSP